MGGDSYVAWHMLRRLGPERSVATFFEQPVKGGVYFDSLKMNLSEVVEDPASISHAVILFGDTKPESCAGNPAKSTALNVDSIKRVIDTLLQWSIKPIFVSSECVFDGSKGGYIETDRVNPILVYGQQKVAVENYLQGSSNEFVITRLGKVLGARPGRGNIFTEWFDALQRCETMYCATDQVFSPIHADDVAEGIAKLIDGDCTGIYHLSGHKPYSRLELLEVFIREYGRVSQVHSEIVPCSIRDFQLSETRPLNLSMKPDKVVETVGLEISAIANICRQAVEDIFEDHQSATS